ncbi:eukaryotic translation initiation factor 3 subunit H [Anopheles aquasalis]|uniref:Eukaryotic translation initiation factor 3 subunit H n=4 Tax=Nyssorhynchus TaxID=44543 RepID=W5JBH2_ANODA|nr:eukaryotic translation initiation factor 3 subunit H [Anopheles albimanus]XP_049547737.1 eukaryotic translation initiation factor 3 subunit H [Anopheles darlingi]XP_050083907.1 eukaryotic translation initiation factor 3 subunit H [Anopheles aquasalis]ETN60195.1 eukaryotic translation initiation factor 3 subunit [Anopheles darlingi]
MASRGVNRRTQPVDNTISYVQCDGLAAMKMVKHCHEESLNNMEVAQGALLGLVVDDRLEITNCFPFPKSDETIDEEEYQLNMMRRLRHVNVDHFHVGWYQSADVGNFLSNTLLESQYHYQTSIEESVVVIYDTQKSARGFLTLKAYRLTPQAIAMYKERDFTPEALRNLKVGYENLFVEIPIVIKNSALCNIMMSELTEMVPEEEGTHFLDLGTASVLENHLRCMMDRVDELNHEATKFNKYQQAAIRQEQEKHRMLAKHAQENAARIAKGETAVPEDEINKLFRPIPVPTRLNPMIVSGQINTYAQHISQFCSQSLAKLYMTQALQNAKDNKS